MEDDNEEDDPEEEEAAQDEKDIQQILKDEDINLVPESQDVSEIDKLTTTFQSLLSGTANELVQDMTSHGSIIRIYSRHGILPN